MTESELGRVREREGEGDRQREESDRERATNLKREIQREKKQKSKNNSFTKVIFEPIEGSALVTSLLLLQKWSLRFLSRLKRSNHLFNVPKLAKNSRGLVSCLLV